MIGIDTITVGGTEDRRLVLQNAMVGRKIDASWNTLLVGIRCSFEFAATNIFSPQIRLGVMTTPTASMANGPLSASGAEHFVGIGTQDSIVKTRSTTTINNYGGAGLRQMKIVDGTVTENTSASSWVWTAEDDNRWPLFVEIIKGSPNFTVTACFWNQVQLNVDISKAQFLTAMGSASIAAVDTYMDGLTTNSYNTASTTFAVNEGTDGTLDSICLAWDRAFPKLYVNDFAYRVLA